MPRCSRHFCCVTCAGIRTSMSAGRSSTEGRHTLSASLGHCLDDPRELVEDFIYLDFAHNQRRTEGQCVADGAEHEIMFKEACFKRFHAALADRIGPAREVNADGQPHRPDIEDIRQTFETQGRLGPHAFEFARALEQTLFPVKVQRRKAGGTSQRMRRICVAMEQLDNVLRPLHESVVDPLPHDHAAHRHCARSDTFGEGDHVGNDAIAFGCEWISKPAIAGDDFVEDQQNSVLVADRAQPLEVPLRRWQYARGCSDRLDNHGGNSGCVMQSDKTIEIVGKMRTPFRLTDTEGLLLTIVSRYQMVDAGEQRTELLAIADDAANGNATEAYPMVTALATDQSHARGVAAYVVIGERNLERGVDCLGTGVAEKYVIKIRRGERGNPAREFERLGMAELERRRIVQRGRFALDGLDDRLAIVTGIRAPKTSGAVEKPTSIAGNVMHVLGADDYLWPLLEGAVGGEGHPIGFEIVGNGDFCLCLACCHDCLPSGLWRRGSCAAPSQHKEVDDRDKPAG